ncbi:MAG: histidine kinase [Clostridiaceae bacterium]
MRRIIETCLILILSLIPLGSLSAVTDLLPVILLGISLCYLVLFSPIKYSDYVIAVIFLVSWYFSFDLHLIAPIMAYGFFQRDRKLVVIPVLVVLIPFWPLDGFLIAVAIWLSYHEAKARRQEKAYQVMRDDFVQNDLLQRRILKEEELNHQKNLEIAILKERNRISREIHDSVGHTISAGLLQIEAMKLSAPDLLKDKLGALSLAMTQGMEEVRRNLHNLHNESISLKSEISELTKAMAQSYEISTLIQMEEEVPIEVKRAFISMLREALTNINNHSDATEIKIVLRELPMHYTATVKDNGSQKPMNIGLGLASMEEMTRSLDGVFSKGWSDGFFVHMTLPKLKAVLEKQEDVSK